MNEATQIFPRVLHVVYNLIRGGTEGQCARLAMGLAARGGTHRVAVFHEEGFFLEEVGSRCGPVYEIAIRKMLCWHTFKELCRLRRFLKKEQFDLVHAWDADAEIFGVLAAQWAGVPFLTSRRDMGEIYPRYKLALMRRADRAAEAVVVNAEAIRGFVLEQGVAADKVVRLPNILDVAEFDQLAEEAIECPVPKGPLIVMVARLDPEKDTGTLLRAMQQVIRQVPDASLVIAGDGPERKSLQAQAATLGLGERVLFLGDVQAVPSLLRHAAIGVLVPSANEGLSNTILEYMAASLPVVATDCGGNRELVRDGVNGFVIPVGTVDALAEKLHVLLEDPQQRLAMGQAGRQRIEQEFSKEKVLDQFEALYLSIYTACHSEGEVH